MTYKMTYDKQWLTVFKVQTLILKMTYNLSLVVLVYDCACYCDCSIPRSYTLDSS